MSISKPFNIRSEVPGHRGIEDLYRLSPVQQGMLFHALSDPEAGMYFEQLLMGGETAPVDLDRLRDAWRRVTARNPILRTSFLWEGLKEPVQVVHREVPLDLRTVELPGDLSEPETRRELERLLEEDRREGFDLSRPPLARWTLIRQPAAEGTRIWKLWSYQHMLLDGWSALAVVRELGAIYEGAEGSSLPERPPFRDYLSWLRRQDLAEAEAYWRRTLAGIDSPTRLALDRAGDARRTAAGPRVRIERRLDPEATRRLQSAAREHRLTLGTLAHAAWGVVLARFSGDQDVVFGTTVSGRPTTLPGADAMVGCFINTLPVRLDCAPGERLGPWLAALQASQVEMRRYEHSPLVSVRQWTDLPSDRPLFESILVFENFDGGSTGGNHAPRVQRADAPLLALVEPQVDDLLLRAGFDSDRFSTPEAERILDVFAAVLQRLPAALEQGGTVLDLLAPTADEARRLAEWNRVDEGIFEPGDELPVPRRVAERAEEGPDRVALVTEDGCWTYGAVVEHAHDLARRLRARGAGPGTLVGVAVARSAELPIALLGVLASGAAYVPLDPDLPTARLGQLLADAITNSPDAGAGERTHLVVADAGQAERVAAMEIGAPTEVVPPITLGDADGLTEPTTPEPTSPAYVLYTSGTTGEPKGVVIPHGALARRISWGARHDLPGPGDAPADEAAYLHKTTAAFDVSVLEIFVPLVAGGRVVIARAGGQKDPAYLVDLLARERVTHAAFPPSVHPLLLDAGIAGCDALRTLYTSGEAVSPGLVRTVAIALERAPGETRVRFENRYGPTETTIGVTGWVCDPETGDDPVPIGRPIAGAHVHVLGAGLLPAPQGVPGELCVAGPLLGQGYLGRPARTARSFVPHPSATEPGARLYRTGDLARLRADGAALYLGRLDRQVKIRGFRIELEEIEQAITDLPGVREAAVVTRPDGSGADRLVAYWAPDGEGGGGEAALRRGLGERLPAYMVPDVWVRMEALPRTTSQMLDARRLPEPELGSDTSTASHEPPAGDTESAVAALWSEILGVERIGRHDEFHTLGGHSLHLVRVASELRKRLDAKVPLSEVARASTVAELAATIEAAARGELVNHGMDAEALRAEARLDPSIRPDRRYEELDEPDGAARPVLLTGATGFLGAHLLAELLHTTETPVYCLVRARDAATGHDRLRANLAEHRLWDESHADRIVAVPGDLAAERVGLTEEAFRHLADTIGTIFHNGALLDLLRGYDDLAGPNVQGTTELLRLACLGRPTAFVYVSTLSIFDSDRFRNGAPAWEAADVDDPTGMIGGYSQSKWVAERRVLAAGERGLPITVFRPGIVAGDSRTGIANGDDFAGRLFRGCLEIREMPYLLDGPTRLSPVDFVSRSIVRLALDPANRGRIFHPLNPRPTTIPSIFEMARGHGFESRPVPFEEWLGTLHTAIDGGRDSALGPLLPLFPRPEELPTQSARTNQDSDAGPRYIRYECQTTAEAIAEAGLAPPMDEATLIGRFLDGWVERDLLPAPAAPSTLAGAPRPNRAEDGEVRP